MGITLLQDHRQVYPTDGALPLGGGRQTNSMDGLVIFLARMIYNGSSPL